MSGWSKHGEEVKGKVKEVNCAGPVVFRQTFGFYSKESGSHRGI